MPTLVLHSCPGLIIINLFYYTSIILKNMIVSLIMMVNSNCSVNGRGHI